MYVIRRSKELTACLTKHQYHPQQIHWVIQMSIVSISPYSIALAEWDHASLTVIQTVLAQAQKKAWKLPASTDCRGKTGTRWHGRICHSPKKLLGLRDNAQRWTMTYMT